MIDDPPIDALPSALAPTSVPQGASLYAPFSTVAMQPGRGNIIDELMAMLAMIALPLELPFAQPIRVPIALLMIGYLILRWGSVVVPLRLGRWFFLLPILCVISALWAQDTMAALRHGSLIGFTMMVAATIAVRLDIRQIAAALLLSQGVLAIASLISMTSVWVGGLDGGLAVVGIFPHKNVIGARMVWIVLAGLVVIFAQGFRPGLRLLAMGLVPIALLLIAKAHSATALIMLGLGIPMGVLLVVVWPMARRVRGLLAAGFMGAICVLSLGALVATNTIAHDPISVTLDSLGKDDTLTGRTKIWALAKHEMADHPILGVGAGNFWRADNNQASHIVALFPGASVSRFSFHNLLIELVVHLGGLGAFIAMGVYAKAAWSIGSAWRYEQSGANALYAVVIMVFVLRSFADSALFAAINLDTMLFWTLAFSALLGRSLPVTIRSAEPAFEPQ